MHYIFKLSLCWWVVSLLLLQSASANTEEKHRWEGRLEAGIENDSTVIIDELDSVVDDSSSSRLLRLHVNYRYTPDDTNEWLFSANAIRKNFRESNTFDSSLQIYSAGYSRDFEKLTAGLRSQAITSDLDGEGFLSMQQYSPYFSFFVGKQWFLNLALNITDKTIKTDRERSADGREFTLDGYHFLQGINHYLLFSVRSGKEEAENSLYSFTSGQFRVGWVKKLKWLDKAHKVRVNWRYLRRNYNQQLHPKLDEFRVDNRRQWDIEWETELTDNFILAASFRLNEQDSRLSSASYDQKISSVVLQYHF